MLFVDFSENLMTKEQIDYYIHSGVDGVVNAKNNDFKNLNIPLIALDSLSKSKSLQDNPTQIKNQNHLTKIPLLIKIHTQNELIYANKTFKNHFFCIHIDDFINLTPFIEQTQNIIIHTESITPHTAFLLSSLKLGGILVKNLAPNGKLIHKIKTSFQKQSPFYYNLFYKENFRILDTENIDSFFESNLEDIDAIKLDLSYTNTAKTIIHFLNKTHQQIFKIGYIKDANNTTLVQTALNLYHTKMLDSIYFKNTSKSYDKQNFAFLSEYFYKRSKIHFFLYDKFIKQIELS